MLPSGAWLSDFLSYSNDMATLVKIHRKGQMTLPSRLRSAIGVTEGGMVEASVRRGKIVLTPKVVIDHSKIPNADDEYTPAQRRFIDARIAEGMEDFKKGRFYGPFRTADEMIASMQSNLKRRATAKKNKLTLDEYRLLRALTGGTRRAPASVRKAFYKQARLLAANLHHPSLRAKKYNEANDVVCLYFRTRKTATSARRFCSTAMRLCPARQ